MSEYLFDLSSPEPPEENPEQKNPEQENPPAAKPGHSTGPTTLAGKERSSMNALIHGCRSEKHVLPDEDPEEFAFVVRSWFENYHPADDIADMIVSETALAHWHFKRNSKRLAEIEFRLPGDAWHWTAEHIKLFNTFSRYKTTTGRQFRRWFTDLESHYDRLHRREHLDKLAGNKRIAIETKWLEGKAKVDPEKLKAKQFITVESPTNAPARTLSFPTAEEIVAQAAQRSTPPLIVERAINFPEGVPVEYDWLNPNHLQRSAETWGVQRMTYSEWLELTELEKASGSGHIGTLSLLRREPAEPRLD
jgi:hypothetical protein